MPNFVVFLWGPLEHHEMRQSDTLSLWKEYKTGIGLPMEFNIGF